MNEHSINLCGRLSLVDSGIELPERSSSIYLSATRQALPEAYHAGNQKVINVPLRVKQRMISEEAEWIRNKTVKNL